jgi:hypothetical protein
MKKIVSMTLVLAMTTLMLSSCNLLDYGEELLVSLGIVNKKEHSDDLEQTSRPPVQFTAKVLFSYDDVMKGLGIVREKYYVDPEYTVDYMGEDYIILYYFRFGWWEIEYPIDFETYFSTFSNGDFITIIFLKNQTCTTTGRHGHSPLMLSPNDENYAEVLQLKKSYASVYMMNEMGADVRKLTDFSLFSYYKSTINDDIHYFVKYDGKPIITLWSCVELDDKFFEDFFNGLVTNYKVRQ